MQHQVPSVASPVAPALSSRAGRAAYYRLGLLLGGLSALGPLAIDMYLPSFPAIAREFGVAPSAVQMTLPAYFVGLAVGQTVFGPVTDRLGRKPPLLFGLLLFVLASAGSALAPSVGALAVLRFLQALGGAAQVVVVRAVVRDRFGERDGVRMLSHVMLVMGLAPILAPLAGGLLIQHAGWRAVFWVLGGFGALMLAAVASALPETLPAEHRQRHGPGEVLRVYARLLRDRPFVAYALCSSMATAGLFAYISGAPFVFIEVFGVAPEHFGLFFGANAAGLIAAAQVNSRIVGRVGARRVLRAVLPVSAAAGALLLAAAASGAGGPAGVLAPLFVFVASLGFVSPNTTVLAMAAYGRGAGSASALLGTLPFLAGAASGALVGALHDGTARPMGLVVAACALGACLAFLPFDRRTP